MLRTGIAFLAGIGLIHLLPVLPDPHPWCWILSAMAVLLMLLRSRVGLALIAGIVLAWSSTAARLADDLPVVLEGVDLLVRGYVASLPDTIDTDPQFEFEITQAPAGVSPRIRLSWYDSAERPKPGELWQLVVRLKRRNGFANPGGFDYEAQLLRQGIGATGYVRNDERNVRIATASARYAVLRIRAWLAGRIAVAVGPDPMLGILQGLAVGDTSAMSASQWRVLAATGTTHLMAISGLHITMVAALAAWLGGGVVRWRHAQRLRLTAIHGRVLFGGIAAIAYAALAGFSVPTQRTLAMLCIVFAVRAACREFSVASALGIALVVVLLIDPFAPLSVGAWLSFGAVAAILLASSGRRNPEGMMRSFARTQIAVTVGLMPILLGAFGSLSLVSPLANAVAVPVFTLILVPIVLLGALLAVVSVPLASAILGLATQILRWFWPLLDQLAQAPLAQWHFPQLPGVVYVALSVGAVVMILPGITATRVTAVLLCLPAAVWRPHVPDEGEFRFTLLDVGQGLAAVVRTRSHVLVYDAGPAFRSGRDTGEVVVVPYLYSQGIRAVDTLMISHGDLDHRGGMESILRSVPVVRLLTGPSVQSTPLHRATLCQAGQRWTWDGVQFEVLHPASAEYAHDNDSSCVLRIEGSGGSALLAGDLQQEGESVVAAAGLMQTDIVVAPHHGSRTSSTDAFIDATRARFVLIPAGYRNRWGFPRQEVIDRWGASGAQPFSTQDSGAVEVDVKADGVSAPRQYRKEHRHYWRAR
ncbi:MAG TPA: DNA internalization-related competence protein ComEC/Rec2 [Povalibacter sp.]